jgi:hypothetical protein
MDERKLFSLDVGITNAACAIFYYSIEQKSVRSIYVYKCRWSRSFNAILKSLEKILNDHHFTRDDVFIVERQPRGYNRRVMDATYGYLCGHYGLNGHIKTVDPYCRGKGIKKYADRKQRSIHDAEDRLTLFAEKVTVDKRDDAADAVNIGIVHLESQIVKSEIDFSKTELTFRVIDTPCKKVFGSTKLNTP